MDGRSDLQADSAKRADCRTADGLPSKMKEQSDADWSWRWVRQSTVRAHDSQAKEAAGAVETNGLAASTLTSTTEASITVRT